MSQSAQVVLAVGSSRDVLLRGGPAAWLGKPSQYFRGAESEDEEVVTVTMLEEVAHPFTAARVLSTRLALHGKRRVEFSSNLEKLLSESGNNI